MSHLSPTISPVSDIIAAIRLGSTGEQPMTQTLAEEVPFAFHYNGFSHAVMMTTPDDLDDFVLGFSLTEGVIEDASDIRAFRIRRNEDGLTAAIELAPASLRRFLATRRLRRLQGYTGCGLCGVEDLSDIRRICRRLPATAPLKGDAIEQAVRQLREFQPLSRGTRAAHAAAWVDVRGHIVAVREDVGRHNALDKLIGAMLRQKIAAADGFCLITSRCSFEMAQKAIAAGFAALVSVSAPTAYAVRTAQSAGLALYSLSREGGQLLYTKPSMPEGLSHVDDA